MPSEEQVKNSSASSSKENLGFQTEVSKLLHLMIHSLYSNRDIFLRELISNASDALDKLRFLALSQPELLAKDPELDIHVDFNKDLKTITISDSGIGMSRDEVISHLGTIARSGTGEFLSRLTGEQKKDAHLIGQFGVGFYSAFMVADRVEVLTRRADLPAEEGVRWESTGESGFTIESKRKTKRGTMIILHLKEDATDYADGFRLRSLIRKYSDHIAVPIIMKKDLLPKKTDKNDEKLIEVPEEETVNTATALWTRSRQEITENEYNEFYKHISHDFEDPLIYSHNRVEGNLEYTGLLYIPSKAPFDLWNRDAPRGLKLYIQRVFIMDNAEQFLPLYLRFVKGVIDCKDLALNVSREILQQDPTIEKIRSALTKRVLSMLEKLQADDKEKYAKFWNTFGLVLKEGIAEDMPNKERIAKLLRFSTTHTDKEVQDQTLDDYLSRMVEGQDKIYFVAAENFTTAKNSPHLEIFRKKNIEVLILYDRIDEWVMNYLGEYQGKTFKDIARGELDLGKLKDQEEKSTTQPDSSENKKLVDRIKQVLSEQVAEVRITERLTDSPACITVGEQELSLQMRQILSAAGQKIPDTKPIFEINVEHPLIQKLQAAQDEERFAELTQLLFEEAKLAEGGQLSDPVAFIRRLNKLLVNSPF